MSFMNMIQRVVVEETHPVHLYLIAFLLAIDVIGFTIVNGIKEKQQTSCNYQSKWAWSSRRNAYYFLSVLLCDEPTKLNMTCSGDEFHKLRSKSQNSQQIHHPIPLANRKTSMHQSETIMQESPIQDKTLPSLTIAAVPRQINSLSKSHCIQAFPQSMQFSSPVGPFQSHLAICKKQSYLESFQKHFVDQTSHRFFGFRSKTGSLHILECNFFPDSLYHRNTCLQPV